MLGCKSVRKLKERRWLNIANSWILFKSILLKPLTSPSPLPLSPPPSPPPPLPSPPLPLPSPPLPSPHLLPLLPLLSPPISLLPSYLLLPSPLLSLPHLPSLSSVVLFILLIYVKISPKHLLMHADSSLS